jgi:hypothetical protein
MFAQTDDVILDPAAAHPELGMLRTALRGHDWAACRAVLDAASPGGRSALLNHASDERGVDEFLRYVLQTRPEDSAAAALLALNLVDIGWEVRGSGWAADVPADRFALFHDRLRQAEAVLIDAAARCPADPALWVARLVTARGLRLGQAETRRRYDRLAATDPHHLTGQWQFLQSLCPKWGGAWPALHAWAWEAMAAAPPGAVQGTLVADAHLEQWMAIAGSDLDAAAAYLASEPVRGALHRAAQHSVWHPQFRAEHGWVQAASSFAMAFSLMGDRPAAAATFARLGPLAHRWPWEYLGDDVAATIRGYRNQSLVAGGAR